MNPEISQKHNNKSFTVVVLGKKMRKPLENMTAFWLLFFWDFKFTHYRHFSSKQTRLGMNVYFNKLFDSSVCDNYS